MIGGEINYAIDLSENFNGYFSLAKGYKAGGFNLGTIPKLKPPALYPFVSEK